MPEDTENAPQSLSPRVRTIRHADANRVLRELDDWQRNASSLKNLFNHLEHTDKSRKHIAYVFVYGYIILVSVIVVGVPLYNWLILGDPKQLELDKILAQVGALIGSPLGFVVGYYFKEDARSR